MEDREARRARVLKLFQEGSKPARKRAPRGKAAIEVKGDQNVVAGRDVHINRRETTRVKIEPPPGSLSPAQARRLQNAIEKMVDIEAAGGVGDGDRAALFAKWHKMLKDRFSVPSYRVIPAAQADEAIAWLKQVAAMNRPKLRRTDNAAWRNEHYKAIWAHARELGMSKGDVYSIVAQRMNKQITSLKQLGEQSLLRLYEIVMGLRQRI